MKEKSQNTIIREPYPDNHNKSLKSMQPSRSPAQPPDNSNKKHTHSLLAAFLTLGNNASNSNYPQFLITLINNSYSSTNSTLNNPNNSNDISVQQIAVFATRVESDFS
jgi:hypothetical protein